METTNRSHHTHRTAWFLVALLLGLGVSGPAPADPTPAAVTTVGLADTAPAAPRPAVTIVGLTEPQVAVVDWATGLFAEAGLDLPPVTVVRHSTDEPCQGRMGIAYNRGDHSEIGLCTDEADVPVEFMVLHELAHAWDHHSLDESRRQEFLELRGLEHWRGADTTWYERGAEHAAEIMVWGLIDRPIRSVRIDDTSCAALGAGYRVLTGQGPLHGYTDHC